ncbi:50S ribosomal protein L29 [Priestia taiwanensis]|uniref:50S ribosomal protein L29 n=1 Tax=Priestia taiwanensis TaxID=1347902 RepID=A0A917AMP3_9BACI|nr:50S ribosomal protein L29 [Priestia taiwanensis]MBM7362342.1 hypothetical protein [Priestia taiwanensis]GGE61404.1 hypothetical protein GCM10007140_09650 [Priestia taiwanensis]
MKDNQTVLGLNKSEKTLITTLPAIIGGVLGWFAPAIANWVLTLPIVPMEGLLETITSFHHLWVSIIGTILGIAAGSALTLFIFHESLEVTVSSSNVQLKFKDNVKTIEKNDISTIYIHMLDKKQRQENLYLENKHLVILGNTGNELYREIIDVKQEAAREVFERYEYPWAEEDPFADAYERWVPAHPDFPEKINVLLSAREKALKKDKRDEAKYLREDLAKLGVVIKDQRKGQYVRLAKEKEVD